MKNWTKFSIAYWSWAAFILSVIWILKYAYWAYASFVAVLSLVLIKIFIKPEMLSEERRKKDVKP